MKDVVEFLCMLPIISTASMRNLGLSRGQVVVHGR